MSKNRRTLNQIKRNNAKLFPIYKMFSWDLLFFYSIEFLYYTITKKVTASDVLIINGFYLFFRIIMQIPAVAITDTLGRRKGIITGNVLLIIYVFILVFVPGAIGIIIADMVFSLGYDIKVIAEAGILYDSVSTRGGEGLFSKIDAKGGSWHYLLDGIASLTAGYLFVINNYMPLVVCLIFILISTVLSFRFRDVYTVDKEKVKNTNIKEYTKDLFSSSKLILKSKRIKAFLLFGVIFYGIIYITKTYNSDLLITIGIPEEQFSMIFAIFTLLEGIALSLKKQVEKKYKNKTLQFLSLVYIAACIVIGIISSITYNNIIMPIILIMIAMQRFSMSIWYILEAKYLKNFTTNESRNKVAFVYEFIGGITSCIFSVIGGLLLKVIEVSNAYLIVGLASLALMTITLDYMRKRIGLRPKDYKKEDIYFESIK